MLRSAKLAAFLLASAAVAQQAPADPISDRLRFEIALAQRNYLIAKAQLDKAAAAVRDLTTKAQEACAAAGQQWREETFVCGGEKPREGERTEDKR